MYGVIRNLAEERPRNPTRELYVYNRTFNGFSAFNKGSSFSKYENEDLGSSFSYYENEDLGS